MRINWTAAGVIVTIVLAICGGLWGFYVYSHPAATQPEMTAMIEYEVCSAANERECMAHNAFVQCGKNVEEWAAEKCRQFRARVVTSNSGGMCGNSITKVTCTAKK
jgi:hypothetical protein